VELVERWPAAVGEAIARHAWPARLARDGTLHVHTSDSVWAFELAHRAAEIAARACVAAVRFAPGPLPEPPRAAAAEAVLPTPADEELARALAAGIEAENLRATVQKAITFSLARGRSTRGV
jgi:hypothetical protein